VPEQWPHVRQVYERGGFKHSGRVEIIYMAGLSDIVRTPTSEIPGLTLERSVGINGTRLSARLAGETAGYIEVELLDAPHRSPGHVVWADIGNLHVSEGHRRRGVARWLIGEASDWLRLSGVDHLLAYATPEQQSCISILEAAGFWELTRTARGWTREVS
jgi:GNAT superfamily N-acetyltransferase